MSLFRKSDKAKSAKNGSAKPPPFVTTASKIATSLVTPEPGAPLAAKPELKVSGDQAKAAAQLSHRVHLATGQIMTVLMNAPECQKMTLENVRALVSPAIATGQFVMAMAQSKESGYVAPAGVALWASVSDEVDKRLSKDFAKFSIAGPEWNSGPHAWLIMMVGDRRVLNPMLSNFQKTTLSGRTLKVRAAGKDGKVAVRKFIAAEDSEEAPAPATRH